MFALFVFIGRVGCPMTVAWYQQSSPGQYTVIRAPCINSTSISPDDDDDDADDNEAEGDAVGRPRGSVFETATAAFILDLEVERLVLLLLLPTSTVICDSDSGVLEGETTHCC